MKRSLNRLIFGGAGASNWLGEIGLLVLRVTAGLCLAIGHGLGKLPPSSGFVSNLGQMGVPVPTFSAWMAGLGEFVGGLLLAAGLATRVAAIWLVGVFTVAVFVRHRGSFTGDAPFFLPAQGSVEGALLYLVIAVCFVLIGSGRTGVDRYLRK